MKPLRRTSPVGAKQEKIAAAARGLGEWNV
jgi:hypothetical protein